MDPTKNESSLDPAWDHVHYVAPDLPEPLPKLDEVEHRFSQPTKEVIRAMQLNENSHYIVKRDIHLVREGWTMLYLKKMTSIPIPTVYAILTNKAANRDTIIMEYIPSPPLAETWSTLEVAEKEDTAKQLAAYLTELRALPSPGFFGQWLPPEFGSLDKGPLVDPLFTPWFLSEGFGGPFDTMQQLGKGLEEALSHSIVEPARHKFYCGLIQKILAGTEGPPVFTHGDLQLRNIIRKQDGQVVIIDWGQSSWSPAWWEYSVTAWAADFRTDWPTYIPKFLPECPEKIALIFLLRTIWISG